MLWKMRHTPIALVKLSADLTEGVAFVAPPQTGAHTPRTGPRPVLPDFASKVVLEPEDLAKIAAIIQARVDLVIAPRVAEFQAALDAHAPIHAAWHKELEASKVRELEEHNRIVKEIEDAVTAKALKNDADKAAANLAAHIEKTKAPEVAPLPSGTAPTEPAGAEPGAAPGDTPAKTQDPRK